MLNKPALDLRQTPSYSVPPVVRAIKVLRYIAAGRSVANQSRAAREIGINRTTLLRLLHTLEAERMIEPVGGGEDYVLGIGMIELAAQKLSSLDVAQVAQPILNELSAELGLSCHLGILDRREVVYVLRVTPDVHLVSNVRVGTRLPAHASSMGRVILAHMPADAVDRLLSEADLFSVTEATPTTMNELHADLERVRAAGFVDSRSSFEVGIDSVAAPLFDFSGAVVAAINASGPAQAFGGARSRRGEITAGVRRAGEEISRSLGFAAAGGSTKRPGAADARGTR